MGGSSSASSAPMTNLVGPLLPLFFPCNPFSFSFIFPGSANLVLQDTIERVFVDDSYGDIPRGIFLVRGENVVLLGEVVGGPSSEFLRLPV